MAGMSGVDVYDICDTGQHKDPELPVVRVLVVFGDEYHETNAYLYETADGSTRGVGSAGSLQKVYSEAGIVLPASTWKAGWYPDDA